jgi:hypothetical protein
LLSEFDIMTVTFRALFLGALVAVASPAALAADNQYQKQALRAADSTPLAAPGVPAPKALPPEIGGECAWVGKRIVSLLARDDVDTSKRFLEFYRLFGCREAHLAPSFRCVVAEDEKATRTDETSPEEALSERVDRCWATVD